MLELSASAPGRINIIGEHTDYNSGWVLPAAIQRNITFYLKKRSDRKIILHAYDKNELLAFNLDDFEKQEGWANYILGVIDSFQKRMSSLSGFEGHFSGNIPIGSGLSSSAALTCSLATGLNALFELNFSPWELIQICQEAEINFSGTQCGIMDQFASILGKKDCAMLLNCHSLRFEYIPVQTGEYQFVLLNTNIEHQLTNSAYNQRRAECQETLSLLKHNIPIIQNLSELSGDDWQSHRQQLPEVLRRRCQHVLDENARTKKAAEALQTENLPQLGRCMFDSHASLQNLYDVSCPELDFLVEHSKKVPGVLGSRMMGGGFGGCTLNLVHSSSISRLLDQVGNAYLEKFGITMTPLEVKIGGGARIVSS